MLALRARWEIIRSLGSRSRTSVDDERAFDVWCLARFDAYASLISVAALLVMLIFWVTFWWAPRAQQGIDGAFGQARIAWAAASLSYFLLPRTAFISRHLVLIYALLMGVGLYYGILPFARLGGLDSPYIHLWAALPLWTIALPMRIGARVAVNCWLGACLLASVFVSHPEQWGSTWALLLYNFLGGYIVFATALGQFVMILYRKTFFQMQALTRHGAGLEQTVAERTQEVRDLVVHVETSQEAERTRIARDLHDDLGQELTALRYAMATTQQRFAVAPTTIGPDLAELEVLLSRTSSSMQSVVTELRPRILDDLGFSAAARWLVSRIAERTPLDCEIAIDGPDDAVGDAHRTAAFRILQEALTNVIKHAGARHAKVTIAISASALDVTIADDGKGLSSPRPPSSAERPGGGMGLLGMRERTRALGGTLVVTDRQKGGVEVRCHLPLYGTGATK